MAEKFTFDNTAPDFHAVYSITLGELLEGGFDPFGEPQWAKIDWYDDAQRERFEEKFKLHYYWYELGITPVRKWRMMLTAKVWEQMPKYKPIYKALNDGQNILGVSDEYGKGRNVYSDFPATQLAPSNQDYASNARDNEYEKINTGDFLEKMKQLKDYNDLDLLLIKDCEVLFSCLSTVQTNW